MLWQGICKVGRLEASREIPQFAFGHPVVFLGPHDPGADMSARFRIMGSGSRPVSPVRPLLDAEYLVRLAVNSGRQVSPPRTEDVATAAYLGQLLGLLGRWQEAESVLQEAYRQALAGSDSQSIGVVASSLGSIYRYQGNTARALPLLRVAHRRLVEARGPTDYAVGVVLTEIGLVQASDGKMITAKSTFVEAKSILAAAGTAAEVVTCDLYLGATEIEQGQFVDGEVRIQNALRTIAADDQTALASAGRAMVNTIWPECTACRGARE